MDCSTQWRHAGMAGIPTGLDMAGVAGVLQIRGTAGSRELLGELRVMEAAALSELRKRWKTK